MVKSIFAVALALASSACTLAAPGRRVIALQPLGTVDSNVVATVATGIRSRFDVDVVVLTARPLPASAYTAARRRYRADRLLETLDAEAGVAYKIVGLTSRDISTKTERAEDWGVYGLSEFDGRAGVVSTYRLGRNAHPGATLLDRTVKAVNHELGHTFGAEHCSTPGCVMADAAGSTHTVDAGNGRFCAACLARIGAIARHDAPEPRVNHVASMNVSPDSSGTRYAAPGPPKARPPIGGQ